MKYNVSQAMTLTELQRFRKMYTLSGLKMENPDHHLLFLSIDIEGWNNSFRRTFCEPIGEFFFDKVFNSSHFKCFMDIYELSRYICSDQTWDYAWDGQFGGIEGLSQKSLDLDL